MHPSYLHIKKFSIHLFRNIHGKRLWVGKNDRTFLLGLLPPPMQEVLFKVGFPFICSLPDSCKAVSMLHNERCYLVDIFGAKFPAWISDDPRIRPSPLVWAGDCHSEWLCMHNTFFSEVIITVRIRIWKSSKIGSPLASKRSPNLVEHFILAPWRPLFMLYQIIIDNPVASLLKTGMTP